MIGHGMDISKFWILCTCPDSQTQAAGQPSSKRRGKTATTTTCLNQGPKSSCSGECIESFCQINSADHSDNTGGMDDTLHTTYLLVGSVQATSRMSPTMMDGMDHATSAVWLGLGWRKGLGSLEFSAHAVPVKCQKYQMANPCCPGLIGIYHRRDVGMCANTICVRDGRSKVLKLKKSQVK